MTEYGNPSRVSVNVSGGGITSITGGEERKAVIFARGDPEQGSVITNEPTQVSGPGELGDTFGDGTPMVDQVLALSGNGVAYEQIHAVVPDEIAVADEDLTGGADAIDHTGGSKIANAPIVEDTSLITVVDDTGGEVDVVFKYETNTDSTSTDFTNLTPADGEIFINPNTGEWIAGTSDNYSIDYTHVDWQSAFEAATSVVKEQELGNWFIDSENDTIISDANAIVQPLRRKQWKMVTVTGPVEPNATGDDGNAEVDVGSYTDSVDSGASFLFAPGRADGETQSLVGVIGGIMAGNSITNPITGEELSGVSDLEQTLNVPQQEQMEGSQVMPLSNSGTPSIEGNVSTSTASDWLRTYFSRRVADRLILGSRAVAKATRGKLNNDNTETIVEQQVGDEIVEMIEQGLLRPNEEGEQRWFVNVTQDATNQRELEVEFGFTPTGVVDVVTVNATINY